jgi:flavorubredoxin
VEVKVDVLIVAESLFGNSSSIAEVIAAGIRPTASAVRVTQPFLAPDL